MDKIILFTLLLLASCAGDNNQEMLLAIQDCEAAGLRAVYIHNLEGVYTIQCREYKDE